MDFGGTGGFKYEWIIENFSHTFKKKEDKFLCSPIKIGQTKWDLALVPNLDCDRISVKIMRAADCEGPDSLTLQFQCFVQNDLTMKTSHEMIFEFKRGEARACVGFDKKEYATISAFSAADSVTVFLWMKFVDGFEDFGYGLARTVIEVKRVYVDWGIRSFSALQVGTYKKLSFESSERGKLAKTLIRLFLKSGSNNDKFIMIQFESRDDEVYCCNFRLSVLHAGGHAIECCQEELIMDVPHRRKNRRLFLTKHRLLSQKELYLPNDTLTLKCECAFATGVTLNKVEKMCYRSTPPRGGMATSATDPRDPSEISLSSSRSSQVTKSLYHNNSPCFVKLQTSTATFFTHKDILGVTSPVFKAMFHTDMKENAEGCVHIGDFKDDTVRRMLEYMYTASIGDIGDWESASELYEAADKYQILSLKEKCSEFLRSHLRVDNACRILVLSDMHCDENLKLAAQDIILRNDKDIMNSTEWADLMASHLKLAAETMHLRFKI